MSPRSKNDGWTDEERRAIQEMKTTGLTIGVELREPYAYKCHFEAGYPRDPEICQASRGPGLGIEFTSTLCDRLKIPCKFILANISTAVGDPPNHDQWKWIGKINEAVEFDTTLPWLYQDYDKRQIVNFTMPVFFMEAGIMIRSQYSYKSDFWFVVQPFQWQVWLIIFLVLFLLAMWDAGLKMIENIFKGRSTVNGHSGIQYLRYVENSSFEHFGLLLQKGVEIKTHQSSRRMLQFAWGVVSLILMAIYGGFLVSTQVAAYIELPFENLRAFADAIDKKQYKLLIYYPSSYVLEQIKTTMDSLGESDSSFKILNDALIKNPVEIVYNTSDIVQRVINSKENLAFWSSKYNLKALARSNCNVTIIPLDFTDFGAYAFRIKKYYADVFTKLIINFKDKGYFLERLEQKYSFGRSCEQNRKPDKFETYTVSMSSVEAVFMALIIGMSLSCLIFLVEILLQRSHAVIYLATAQANLQSAVIGKHRRISTTGPYKKAPTYEMKNVLPKKGNIKAIPTVSFDDKEIIKVWPIKNETNGQEEKRVRFRNDVHVKEQ